MFASCSLVFPEFSFFATLLFFPENYVTLRLWSIHRFFTIIIFSETIFNVQLGINNHLRAPAILLVFWRIYEFIFKSCSLLNRSYFFSCFSGERRTKRTWSERHTRRERGVSRPSLASRLPLHACKTPKIAIQTGAYYLAQRVDLPHGKLKLNLEGRSKTAHEDENLSSNSVSDSKITDDITWPFGDTKFLFEWAQQEKGNFVSPSGHAMFYLFYKIQCNTKTFHYRAFLLRKAREACNPSNVDLFVCEDNVIFTCENTFSRESSSI